MPRFLSQSAHVAVHALLVLACAVLAASDRAWGDILVLKNGMQLQGDTAALSGIGEDAFAPSATSNVNVELIVLVDDGLTRTFVSKYQIADMPPDTRTKEVIRLKQKVELAGERRIGNVGSIVGVTPFDDWGHRTFSVLTPGQQINIVQGITEITPKWTRVQGLRSRQPYVWDMRIATSSIPRDRLRTIIFRHHDENDADVWLSLVRLYLQSDQYAFAEEELREAIQRFPDLQQFQQQLKELRQLRAQQQIDEMKLRQAVGQHRLVASLLEQFPHEDVAGEILLQVSELSDAYRQQAEQGESILQSIAKQLSSVRSEAHREILQGLSEELKAELNFNTLPRMVDYLRLLPDKELEDEQKLAIALSGWLLGGQSTENLAVATSLWKVREIVAAYLRSSDAAIRPGLVAELTSQEGGTAEYVAQILATLKPPIRTEGLPDRYEPAAAIDLNHDPLTAGEANQIDASKPVPPPGNLAARASEVDPLSFSLVTKGIQPDESIPYVVQLPPEYDANRRYPAIVTLHAAGGSPELQVDWWAGTYDPKLGMRRGQAGRQGYIVIAPAWSRPRQRRYEYSAAEHAAVLFALRDACQRFSIDTDRVFLSGHSMGGDAAWDIALAHPDLWAGAMLVGAMAEYDEPSSPKYVSRYWENGRLLPLYFVSGSLDVPKLDANARDHNRYLKHTGFNTMVVEYRGRGDEHFQDEIQRLFQWMTYHRRELATREFTAHSMRPWDNFFYWVEVDGLPAGSVILPTQWPARGRPTVIEGKVRDRKNILLDVGTDEATIWLSPELVDFDADITLRMRGRNQKLRVRPDVGVMLEDARQRAERQSPFWAKVEVGNSRKRN